MSKPDGITIAASRLETGDWIFTGYSYERITAIFNDGVTVTITTHDPGKGKYKATVCFPETPCVIKDKSP